MSTIFIYVRILDRQSGSDLNTVDISTACVLTDYPPQATSNAFTLVVNLPISLTDTEIEAQLRDAVAAEANRLFPLQNPPFTAAEVRGGKI